MRHLKILFSQELDRVWSDKMENIVKQSCKKKFPFRISKVKEEVNRKVVEDFLGQPNGAVQVGTKNWFQPTAYADYAEQIYNFEARSDDVFICTFPRSGTTWTQEMVWLICNDLDYETAQKIPKLKRSPHLE